MLVRKLDTDAGVAALYARLKGAANNVCAPLEGRDVQTKFRHRDCVATAVSRAVAQIGNPAVSAYHVAMNFAADTRGTAVVARR